MAGPGTGIAGQFSSSGPVFSWEQEGLRKQKALKQAKWRGDQALKYINDANSLEEKAKRVQQVQQGKYGPTPIFSPTPQGKFGPIAVRGKDEFGEESVQAERLQKFYGEEARSAMSPEQVKDVLPTTYEDWMSQGGPDAPEAPLKSDMPPEQVRQIEASGDPFLPPWLQGPSMSYMPPGQAEKISEPQISYMPSEQAKEILTPSPIEELTSAATNASTVQQIHGKAISGAQPLYPEDPEAPLPLAPVPPPPPPPNIKAALDAINKIIEETPKENLRVYYFRGKGKEPGELAYADALNKGAFLGLVRAQYVYKQTVGKDHAGKAGSDLFLSGAKSFWRTPEQSQAIADSEGYGSVWSKRGSSVNSFHTPGGKYPGTGMDIKNHGLGRNSPQAKFLDTYGSLFNIAYLKSKYPKGHKKAGQEELHHYGWIDKSDKARWDKYFSMPIPGGASGGASGGAARATVRAYPQYKDTGNPITDELTFLREKRSYNEDLYNNPSGAHKKFLEHSADLLERSRNASDAQIKALEEYNKARAKFEKETLKPLQEDLITAKGTEFAAKESAKSTYIKDVDELNKKASEDADTKIGEINTVIEGMRKNQPDPFRVFSTVDENGDFQPAKLGLFLLSIGGFIANLAVSFKTAGHRKKPMVPFFAFNILAKMIDADLRAQELALSGKNAEINGLVSGINALDKVTKDRRISLLARHKNAYEVAGIEVRALQQQVKTAEEKFLLDNLESQIEARKNRLEQDLIGSLVQKEGLVRKNIIDARAEGANELEKDNLAIVRALGVLASAQSDQYKRDKDARKKLEVPKLMQRPYFTARSILALEAGGVTGKGSLRDMENLWTSIHKDRQNRSKKIALLKLISRRMDDKIETDRSSGKGSDESKLLEYALEALEPEDLETFGLGKDFQDLRLLVRYRANWAAQFSRVSGNVGNDNQMEQLRSLLGIPAYIPFERGLAMFRRTRAMLELLGEATFYHQKTDNPDHDILPSRYKGFGALLNQISKYTDGDTTEGLDKGADYLKTYHHGLLGGEAVTFERKPVQQLPSLEGAIPIGGE